MHRVHKWWYPRMEEGRVSNEADNLLVGSDGKTTCKTDTGTHREKIVRHLIGRRGTQTVAPNVRRIDDVAYPQVLDGFPCRIVHPSVRATGAPHRWSYRKLQVGCYRGFLRKGDAECLADGCLQNVRAVLVCHRHCAIQLPIDLPDHPILAEDREDLLFHDRVHFFGHENCLMVLDKVEHDFVKNHEAILVAEEVDPIMEKEIFAILGKNGVIGKIYGKLDGTMPMAYEYSTDILKAAISKALGITLPEKTAITSDLKLPVRPPVWCPGCPHRGMY